MAADRDASTELGERVQRAAGQGTPLDIVAGGSKGFLGRITQSETLDVSAHRGILSYEPSELVLTARAGTPLAEIEDALAVSGQMLAFEPPHFGPSATLGGTVAGALSGPRRPYAGAARDFVLGVKILSGEGRPLSFGGQVMKNVAGYDVSRLMVGAMGTLGVLLEISLKVLPRPARDATVTFAMDAPAAIEAMNAWAGKPLPLSGAYHDEDRLHVRLSGTAGGVDRAIERLGGEAGDGSERWRALREHTLAFLLRHRAAPVAIVATRGDAAPGVAGANADRLGRRTSLAEERCRCQPDSPRGRRGGRSRDAVSQRRPPR